MEAECDHSFLMLPFPFFIKLDIERSFGRNHCGVDVMFGDMGGPVSLFVRLWVDRSLLLWDGRRADGWEGFTTKSLDLIDLGVLGSMVCARLPSTRLTRSL